MIESLNVRIGVVIAVILLAVVWILPNFFSEQAREDWILSKDTIVYGLDIKGGLHLVMGVGLETVIAEKTKRLARSFEQELKTKNIAYESVIIPEGNKTELNIVLKSPAEIAKLEKYIEEFYPVTLQILETEGKTVNIQFYETKIREFKKQIVDQAIEVIRNRIDGLGVAEPSITSQGDDRIIVQIPGIDEKKIADAKEQINRAARLDFRIVSQEVEAADLAAMITTAEEEGGFALGTEGLEYEAYIQKLNEAVKGKLPEDTKIVFQKSQDATNIIAGKIPYLIETNTSLGGNELEDATVVPGEFGAPEVNFKFTPEGRRKFSEITEANVNRQMAIVLDEKVQSAPNIQGKINTASARITLGTGNYQETVKEANFIATALRAGALPAALVQLEERTVGPTLGADSIAKGKTAGLVGGILVILFMLVYYRLLGVVANIALGMNVLLLLAILTSLGATLTLPGVAGIVLTVGMAVDANVIIFERIKEELRKGAGMKTAVKDGFGHAISAILDANITTAVVCVVLMYFGTGPVRGFAVTLLCGILTSMFTAIFVSRTVLDVMTEKLKLKQVIKV